MEPKSPMDGIEIKTKQLIWVIAIVVLLIPVDLLV
jgi:hypothetical protein